MSHALSRASYSLSLSLSLLGVAALGASLPAAADCDLAIALADSDRVAGLDHLALTGCLGGGEDDAAISRTVAEGLADLTPEATSLEALRARRDGVLSLLDRVSGSLYTRTGDLGAPWSGYSAIVLEELARVRDAVADYAGVVPAEYWAHGDYGYFPDAARGGYRFRYAGAVDAACPAGEATPACRDAVSAAATLRRHARLVERILDSEVREDLARRYRELQRLDSEWDYYFEEARSQFWWEFAANNALYDPPDDQLARPPPGQLILLHPNAALEYVDGNGTVEQAWNAIALVEVIGYHRLRWSEQAGYSRWPLGASLVTSYTPSGRGDHWGYGGLVHIRNSLSVGAVRRDTGDGDETTFLLSVDLGQLFLAHNEKARQRFRGIDP